MARFNVVLAVTACVALAGCAGGEKIKAGPQFARITCKQYSAAERAQAVAELRSEGFSNSMVANLVDDYTALRAAVCRKATP